MFGQIYIWTSSEKTEIRCWAYFISGLAVTKLRVGQLCIRTCSNKIERSDFGPTLYLDLQ